MSRAPPTPIRSWADMSPAERERISATAKPPKRPDILPSKRGPEPKKGDSVGVVCSRKVFETKGAILFVLADGGEQKWIPKSVIEDQDEMDDGSFVLLVSEWFAKKEGLTDE